MVVATTPAEFAEKWGRRLKGATEDIRVGVDKVTSAPSLAAVAKQDKLKARLIEAIEKGVWAAELKKVTLDDWKGAMKDVGIGRIAGGVDAAAGDMADFGTKLIEQLNRILPEIEKMPDVTLEDSIARSTKMIREMAKFKYKGR